jgi:threonine synthase
MSARGIIEAYRARMPELPAGAPVVTLHEGNTPLVPMPRLAGWINSLGPLRSSLELLAKIEGANPTGSFKDRGMTVAVSRAVHDGHRVVICASTGNTSASAAAYAARAGIRCAVLLPKGEVAFGKLSQALMHGAAAIAIDGNFDDALRLVREVAADEPVALVNSVNPARIDGQKTAAFEIVDVLGDAPDWHVLPVGNAGNITAYWRGYREYHAAGIASRLPKMIGFQAAGAAPFVVGHPVAHPQTLATAIRIGAPASWDGAVAARDDSGGAIDMVTDDEILEAWRQVARLEGVFAEPASLAPIAGLAKWSRSGKLGDAPLRVVATLTGHGLKDPDRAVKSSGAMIEELPADKSLLAERLRYLAR